MKIRSSMSGLLATQLRGIVEIDECFMGGKKALIPGTEKKGIGNKATVFGMCQRGKHIRMFHVRNKKAGTLRPLIYNYILKPSKIHVDGNGTYGKLRAEGYNVWRVWGKAHWSFGGRYQINNNNIESAWMRVQRKLIGVHHGVTHKYLQSYLDEFCFHQRDRGKWCQQNFERAIMEVMFCHQFHPLLTEVREFRQAVEPRRRKAASAR